MVFDDGVTSRLSENHFLMTTTTGNAAAVLDRLEDYLQTEWPDLKVYLTSVTEHWATASIAGPKARELVAELAPDLDLSSEAFPFMSMKEAVVAGLAARIYRISFTGELSYEINVPAYQGMALWEAIFVAGEKHGLTPYGTETMHVLRAEKGFIIVGQETDGTVTPFDLGMDWIVSKKKPDFVGKRSFSATRYGARRPKAACRAPDRGPGRGAARRRADHGGSGRHAAGADAGPCHIELLERDARSLHRDGTDRRRCEPAEPDSACTARRQDARLQGGEAGVF